MAWRTFALLIVGVLVGLSILGGQQALPLAATGAVPSLEWDPRLDDLNVTYRPAENCAQGCWRLISARFEDVDESNGLHHIWVKLLNADGEQMAGQPWHVAWPDGNQRLLSKAAPDWADFAMYAGYDPATGPGPYRAYAGDDEQRSDVVLGMGLPLKQHVSFRLVWQWAEPGSSVSPTPSASPTPAGTPSPSSAFLPIIVRQPTPTPVPATPTPTPLPASPTPTPTSTPSSASSPTPTPTSTPSSSSSPTPTPTPTATSTSSAQYTGVFVGWEPNCSGTQVKGTVRDADGTPLPGVTVRVLLFGIQHGDPPVTDANGFYEFNRFGTSDPLLEIDYTVAIIDPATGDLLSNEVYVRTDRNDCQPGGAGHQIATIDFTRR